ncbi:MAG: hypothetical protein NC938_06430 [Candidatus Omnitrophica bacterium]|nr:hypothetical protein [Candidatus Omnitrophota bacterium]MCM8791314.1 hypothetical protein [Candidatus Omnitrophota bacterium]
MKERSSHILIEKAYIYSQKRRSLQPDGCHYDFENGGWMRREENEEVFLVKSKDINKPMAGTKKADLETGEDQKGE